MKRLIAVAAFAVTRIAGGQPLGPDLSPITTNQYSVDLTQGPVLASVRVTGLAGAYVAIAEGVDGNAHNPAAPAVRLPYSYDNFDYDLGLGVTFPSSIEGSDFFNSGTRTDLPQSEQSGFVFLDIAANLQFGPWGLGFTTGLQQYSLDRSADPALQQDRLSAQFGIAHLVGAHAFADHQLMVGAGTRTTALSVVNENAPTPDQQQLVSMTSAGFEVGALWRPNEQPFRVGAAFHSSMTPSAQADTTREVLYQGTGDELFLPNDVTLPWDVNVGVAVQLGPRPFNPRWVDSNTLLARVRRYLGWREHERQRRRRQVVAKARASGADADAALEAADAELELEAALDELHLERAEQSVHDRLRLRYAKMSRFYVLVSSALLMTGEAQEAVGLEGFLNRTVMRSGERIALSPRLGIETEAVPHWVKLRMGSYIEPTRFNPAINPRRFRVHGTLGFDLKLFEWTVLGVFEEGTQWRLSGALDVSARYLGWSLSVGIWH